MRRVSLLGGDICGRVSGIAGRRNLGVGGVRWLVSVGLVAVVLSLMWLGCRKPADWEESLTQYQLGQIGEAIAALVRGGNALETRNIRKYQEFLSYAEGHGQALARTGVVRDGWDRPYAWEVTTREGQTFIRVISSGKDGVFDHGERDDLYVEIRFRDGSDTELRTK